MKTIEFMMIQCDCGAFFAESELIMTGTENDHTISDWVCPFCGGLDYVEEE